MSTNVSSSFNAAIRRQISKKVLPLTQRFLIAYQFADKKKMAKLQDERRTRITTKRADKRQTKKKEMAEVQGMVLG